jgi:ribonuclease P protein subunit POP4
MIRYEAIFPMYQLWIGYMAELLALSLIAPKFGDTTEAMSMDVDPSVLTTTSALLPSFPPRTSESAQSDLRINVANIHAKLVKAEFVGCLISGKPLLDLRSA